MMTHSPKIQEVLQSPCVHFYLKDAIKEFMAHDPVDALNDAELLCLLMRERLARIEAQQ